MDDLGASIGHYVIVEPLAEFRRFNTLMCHEHSPAISTAFSLSVSTSIAARSRPTGSSIPSPTCHRIVVDEEMGNVALGSYCRSFLASAGECSTADCLELLLGQLKGGFIAVEKRVVDQSQTVFNPDNYLFSAKKGHTISRIAFLQHKSAPCRAFFHDLSLFQGKNS
jgi:hypothetical protein